MTGADGEVMRALGEALMITAQNLGAGLISHRLFAQAQGEDADKGSDGGVNTTGTVCCYALIDVAAIGLIIPY